MVVEAHKGRRTAPIFKSPKATKAYTARTVENWLDGTWSQVKYAYEEAGLVEAIPMAKIHPHEFRHSFAVNALLHRCELLEISKWMGHASAKETERYLEILSIDTHHLMQGVPWLAD